jgi:hypothetical protein
MVQSRITVADHSHGLQSRITVECAGRYLNGSVTDHSTYGSQSQIKVTDHSHGLQWNAQGATLHPWPTRPLRLNYLCPIDWHSDADLNRYNDWPLQFAFLAMTCHPECFTTFPLLVIRV